MSEPVEQNPTEAQLDFIKLLVEAYLDDKLTLTHSMDDRFIERLKRLLDSIDPLFAAKTALYLRHNYLLKSIPNYIAVYISGKASGKKWAKDFYYKMVLQLDDMVEMTNLVISYGGKITNGMRTGFSLAFHKFDSAQLLKYKNRREGFSIQDVANFVHPKASGSNAKGMDMVMGNAVELQGFPDFCNEELFKNIEKVDLD